MSVSVSECLVVCVGGGLTGWGDEVDEDAESGPIARENRIRL